MFRVNLMMCLVSMISCEENDILILEYEPNPTSYVPILENINQVLPSPDATTVEMTGNTEVSFLNEILLPELHKAVTRIKSLDFFSDIPYDHDGDIQIIQSLREENDNLRVQLNYMVYLYRFTDMNIDFIFVYLVLFSLIFACMRRNRVKPSEAIVCVEPTLESEKKVECV